MYLDMNTDVTISLNRIVANRTCTGSGSGMYCSGSPMHVIRSNLISQNEGRCIDSTGGGVFLGPFSTAVVEENVIKENVAQHRV